MPPVAVYKIVPYGVLISSRRPDDAAQETHELLSLDTQDSLDMRSRTDSKNSRSPWAKGSCEHQWLYNSEE